MSCNTSVEIAGVMLKNPVMTASGTFGFGREFSEFYDLSELGAVVVKGLTLKEKLGNPPPRVAETPMGLLNRGVMPRPERAPQRGKRRITGRRMMPTPRYLSACTRKRLS